MDPEKNRPEDRPLPPTNDGGRETIEESPPNAEKVTGQRIQFIPTARPDRGRPPISKEDASSFASPIKRRSGSVHSIPQVITEKDKHRRKKEKELETKQVDIDEHLLPHQDVADRYKTSINIKKADESLGLTSQQAEQLLRDHGPNVLTPPKMRHPFLKYLDCLSSLFNLLLILAGILEYILLGVNYKDNFQNVSASTHRRLPFNIARFRCAFADTHPRLTSGPFSSLSPISMHSLNSTNSRSPRKS